MCAKSLEIIYIFLSNAVKSIPKNNQRSDICVEVYYIKHIIPYGCHVILKIWK